MGVPYVTSFCCCLGLETGAKVVAYLHTVISISLVVVCSVFAAKFGELAGSAEDAGDRLYTVFYWACVAIAAVSVLHVLLAATLLYGVYKRHIASVRVWTYTMTALWALALAAAAANAASSPPAASGSHIFLAVAQAALFFGVLGYCIIAVYSYYLLLKSCRDMEGPSHTPY